MSEGAKLLKRLNPEELELVRTLRAEGHTQRQIAERLGVSQPSIHRWLKRLVARQEASA